MTIPPRSALAIAAGALLLGACATDPYYDDYAYNGYTGPYYDYEYGYAAPPAVTFGFGYSNWHRDYPRHWRGDRYYWHR